NPTYQESVTAPPKLDPSARHAINSTLSAFVADAVTRRHPAAAYDLVTPKMRAGQTRAQWASGELPVPPFDARTASATRYNVLSASAGDANLRVLLQPR